MEHVSTLLSDPVTVFRSMTQLKGEDHQTQLDEDLSQLRREVKNLTSQEQHYLKAYAIGEVDNDWIKAQSGPVKTHRGDAERVFEKLEAQRSSRHPLEDMRESLEEVWQRVKRASRILGLRREADRLRSLICIRFLNRRSCLGKCRSRRVRPRLTTNYRCTHINGIIGPLKREFVEV